MNEQFDEAAKCLAQSVTWRRLLNRFGLGLAGIALAILFNRQAYAADLYTKASASVNGDGTAARPYWRITDALARARSLRQSIAIPASERITIHVAPGTYLGSAEDGVLNKNPRYEVLPLLLNVPDLSLSGAAILELDADGLPVGVRPETETVLTTEEHGGSFGDSLLLITRTTDGGVGDRVSVQGMVFDRPPTLHLGTDVFIDRVADFTLRSNVILHAYAGITSQNASGTIEGNLALHNFGPGLGYLSGGSVALPARLTVRGNRAGDSEGGAMFTAAAFMQEPFAGQNSQEIVPRQQTFDKQDVPDTLELRLEGNDFSDNRTFGVRFVACPYGGYVNLDSENGLSARMTAIVRDNHFDRNGHYGVSVDSAFALRRDKRPDTFSFSGTFGSNQVVDNGRAGFLFAFSTIWVPVANVSFNVWKYLRGATYRISDLDGETAGFDYDNPVTDPWDGTVLNNTLIVNGAVIPQGRKISPLAP